MVQRYTEIPSTQKIRDSLQPILNNDKTALSCSSGTSFPSANIVEGMLCYRTDEKKLYQLIDVNSPKTGWVLIADLNGEFRHIEGGEGNAIDYTAKDLNLWNKMPTVSTKEPICSMRLKVILNGALFNSDMVTPTASQLRLLSALQAV